MARFFGLTQGARGAATRLGTPKSGMFTHCNGWALGAYCAMTVSEGGNTLAPAGADILTVTVNNGSGPGSETYGGFAAWREGTDVRVSPTVELLRNIGPIHLGSAMQFYTEREVELAGEMLLQNPHWAKYLRARLWIEGKVGGE